MENQLPYNAQELIDFIENASVGLHSVGPDGRILWANRAMLELLGYTCQEYVGHRIAEFHVDPKVVEDALKRLLNKEEIHNLEARLRCKDGSIKYFLINSNVCWENGKFLHTRCFMRDITERKNMEEELRQQKEKAQQYLDVAEVILIALNAKGEVSLINKKGTKILGYREDEMIGFNWFDSFLPENVRRQVKNAFEKLLTGANEGAEYYEHSIVTKLGEQRLIAWHNSILKDDAGNITGTVSSGQDITERKRVEESMFYSAAIIDSSADAIIGKTLDGIVTSWNNGAREMYGYWAEEMIGRPISVLVPDDKKDELATIFYRLKNGEQIKDYETLRRRKDGRLIYVSLMISPVQDYSGNLLGASTIARDITERVIAQRNLQILKDKLELEKLKLEQVLSIEEGLTTILNMNTLIDFLVQKTATVLEAQRCSLMLFDENTQELCLKGYSGLNEDVVGDFRLKMGESIAGVVAQQRKPVLVTDIESDIRFSRKNNPSYKSKSFLSVPIELNGNLLGVVNVAEKKCPVPETSTLDYEQQQETAGVFSQLDLKILCMIVRQAAISIETAKMYRELKYLTITDPITNMYNYRHFAQTLDHEIRRIKRYTGPLSLMMIDVDDFKSYNDTFGHQEGDVLLKELGRVINENIRDVDVACRYAGDEFVVILPATEAAEAKLVGEKIKKKIQELSLKRTITISIGIAKCTSQVNRYELILKADMALYRAKKEGKNQVCIN